MEKDEGGSASTMRLGEVAGNAGFLAGDTDLHYREGVGAGPSPGSNAASWLRDDLGVLLGIALAALKLYGAALFREALL